MSPTFTPFQNLRLNVLSRSRNASNLLYINKVAFSLERASLSPSTLSPRAGLLNVATGCLPLLGFVIKCHIVSEGFMEGDFSVVR